MRQPSVLLRHRRLLILLAYLLVVPAGYAAAFLLRYDLVLDDAETASLLHSVPAVAAVRLAVYWRAGLFRGHWQHFGLHDVARVVVAATISSTLAFPLVELLGRQGDFVVPGSVLIMDWVLAISIVGGLHAASRWVREGGIAWRGRAVGRRALIVGAGEAGERVLREVRRDPRLGIRCVGLVDDDERTWTLMLHGTPVLGGTHDLPRLARAVSADLLVLAIPSAAPEQLRRLVQRCAATGLEFRVARPLRDVLAGGGTAEPLRSVRVEDLLGRPAVRLDLEEVAREIAGQVVLISGGAGSIGGELARQCARLGPRRLVLLDHAETPLVFMTLELQRAHPGLEIVPVTGCVTDAALLERVCAVHAPRLVFHAAAYKHVPMMEENVLAAVRVNVFGTLALARAAARHGTSVFVLLSTDKAVNPASVMGATKRVAERLIREHPELRGTRTDFRAVRFGNVLGSDGSVVPMFRRQLAEGGPLTVTHPDVERYFMTVEEAVQLLLQSVALAEAAGRIVMLEMGAPVRIVDLAENLIRLSGREPYGDVPIVFTGLRPGEKLREDLVAASEEGTPTRIEKIRVVSGRLPASARVDEPLALLHDALAGGQTDAVLHHLRALVPECVAPLRGRHAANGQRRGIPPSSPEPGARGVVLPEALLTPGSPTVIAPAIQDA